MSRGEIEKDLRIFKRFLFSLTISEDISSNSLTKKPPCVYPFHFKNSIWTKRKLSRFDDEKCPPIYKRTMESIKKFIEKNLKLKENEEKSKARKSHEVKFLA